MTIAPALAGERARKRESLLAATEIDLAKIVDRVSAERVSGRDAIGVAVVDGVRYPFNSATDLLRFTPLTPVQRMRFGAVSVLLRHLGRGRDLDNLRTEDRLLGLTGLIGRSDTLFSDDSIAPIH